LGTFNVSKQLSPLTGQTNIKHRLFVKIALIVTYVAFFAMQVSHKFYFCASRPCYTASGHSPSAGHKGGAVGSTAKRFALSLDKRFNSTQLIARPEPDFSICLPIDTADTYLQCRPDHIPNTQHFTATPRGPPAYLKFASFC
jgi:hypothetical protein